ncbi:MULTISPECIES: DNA repair ATPase [Halomonas]|uniref:AAA+ ATPase domain-containing protein n=1 Tax=Halomonas halophila TaxID=29573 RepID=A0ABQ0U829_9GAMM|nr:MULTISPECIES: DNA repair ATPase [Halomonas]MDR5891050.1 DNA repair ATPase [Halomonas salina]WJY06974.1 DNA repair ATPase [Halomonas halophila]GEK74555.1 hypothetical protein HHA04nite_30990 [Halomonas halophila]
MSQHESTLERLVEEGSAFSVLTKRLQQQGQRLHQATQALNDQREREFGSTTMSVLGRGRVRTELKSVARDVVRIGSHLLFGFHVQLGLRNALKVEDVFRLYRVDQGDGESTFAVGESAIADSFLDDPRFRTDFAELQQYYSHALLSRLTVLEGMLLMVFQIGEKLDDRRVFRWELTAEGNVGPYVDNRGERQLVYPDRHAVSWIRAGRDDHVQGRAPHLNIADTLFVDNLGGSITFKIENNTDSGEGIFDDPVESDSQSLDDASFEYADLNELLIVRILPYGEARHRYYVFHRETLRLQRLDALDDGFVLLPDHHGLIFPAGYCLMNGEHKLFDVPDESLRPLPARRAPNGEDMLFAFYGQASGRVVLYRYSLVKRQADAPLIGHGAALFDNGYLALFSADQEPSLVHPLQIWRTPFMSETFHAQQAFANDSMLSRIGNPELVRAVAELNALQSLIDRLHASDDHFKRLIRHCDRLLDQFYWLAEVSDEVGLEEAAFPALLKELREGSERVLDEFEKVHQIQRDSAEAVEECRQRQSALLRGFTPDSWHHPEPFMAGLRDLRRQRGDIRTLEERRYVDRDALAEMDAEAEAAERRLIDRTLAFLSTPEALQGYRQSLEALSRSVQEADSRPALAKAVDGYRELSEGLDLIQSMLASLGGEDAEREIQINDTLSSVYSTTNQQRTEAELRLKEMLEQEDQARFVSRLRLFEQGLSNGLAGLSEPEQCDDLMTRLLDQLQELEGQFGEQEGFLEAILEQREAAQEGVAARRAQLMEARQQRVDSLTQALDRILGGLERRGEGFDDESELQAFFAGDAMVLKARELIDRLREMQAGLEADDRDSRLAAIRDAALRGVRDKAEMFEDGGQVVRLGPRHRFTVNRQALELTMLPRDERLWWHLTGTQFQEPVESDELEALRAWWGQTLPSESPSVYRGEYLAYRFLIEHGDAGLNVADTETLQQRMADFASSRYREGYEKGVHDHDAARILGALQPVRKAAGGLRHGPWARALAVAWWLERESWSASEGGLTPDVLQAQCISAGILARSMGSDRLKDDLVAGVRTSLAQFPLVEAWSLEEADIEAAAGYLVEQLAAEGEAFEASGYGMRMARAFQEALGRESHRPEFERLRTALAGRPVERWLTIQRWLEAWHDKAAASHERHYLPEAMAIVEADERIRWEERDVRLSVEVEGLLGDHPRIEQRYLKLQLDDFEHRLHRHHEVVPGWERLQALRHELLERQRGHLRLEEYQPKPLTSFVRNQLITESYLPLIGDNLAKQMGTVGDARRSDLMGMLMLISPPGYGKTTLMEYVAHRLGLVFMKINCPSLGHDVIALDPEQAPHSTARAELEKLNLALEMGNNVMLYLDDIQHTHPEFLQKFISLCDGSRRIDGVWRGQSRTYDLRGKRFGVVMAGNPYTEQGETFRVPDMLANRADIYNLGDVLSGTQELFAMSYIENSLAAHPLLAPLVNHGMGDVYRFMDLAQGKEVASSDFEHDYSAAERQDIVELITRMYHVRDVVMRVNQAYIEACAQDDAYREEPVFRLQGSYRNMNKLVEGLSPAMSEAEVEALIDDHYLGEAQLLTQGAEENLLKLKALRGRLSDEERERWEGICAEFRRRLRAGGDEDTGTKVVRQLSMIVEALERPASL